MTILEWRKGAENTLSKAGINSAHLDVLVLAEDQIKKDRSWILAHPEEELQIEIQNILNTKITQRAQSLPLAYIRGHVEFYGRDFLVNNKTLVPRPESEDMITALLGLDIAQDSKILDVGTGSGCLAITAKIEIKNAQVDGCDVDETCIEVARSNAKKLNTKAQFFVSDLLSSTTDSYDILLCNLPYVPISFPINQAAKHEPKRAIFAGNDGLQLFRVLFEQVLNLSRQPLYILTESFPFQHIELKAIAHTRGYSQIEVSNYIQIFKRDSA